MTTWVIISWVFVALLTAANIFFFLKLKKASDQMMKMAFPNAKNMGDALQQMQAMMGAVKGRGGAQRGSAPFRGPGGGFSPNQDQLKKAMDMLQQFQQKGGKR